MVGSVVGIRDDTSPSEGGRVDGFVGDVREDVADLAHLRYVTEQDMQFGVQTVRCAAGPVPALRCDRGSRRSCSPGRGLTTEGRCECGRRGREGKFNIACHKAGVERTYLR